MPSTADRHETLVAIVPRTRLSDALAAVQIAGIGRSASVVDPIRGDLEGRLRRLGVPATAPMLLSDADAVFVIVSAPGRLDATETLMRANGAISIERCGRLTTRERAWSSTLFGGVEDLTIPPIDG